MALARTLTSRYDLASRKWDVVADSQTILNAYDAAGRVDYVDDSYLGVTNNRVDYAYDAAGNRTTLFRSNISFQEFPSWRSG